MADANLVVKHVNHAPTWVGSGAAFSPVIPGTTAPAGDTVAAVFGTCFQDIDAGTTVGIAVAGLTGMADGTWEYSTDDGTIWTPFGAVSAEAARLLSGDDLVRFLPNAGFVGTATLEAYAWDGSTGNDGSTADLIRAGKAGGSTAFSTTLITGALLVNTAPVLMN